MKPTYHVMHPDVPGPVGSYDNIKDAAAHHAKLDKPGIIIAVKPPGPDPDGDADADAGDGDDDFDDTPQGKDFHLPKDHQPGMQVPQGGSSCASCSYYKPDPTTKNGRCGNEMYAQFYKTDEIPAPADSYCSDWYEPQGQS